MLLLLLLLLALSLSSSFFYFYYFDFSGASVRHFVKAKRRVMITGRLLTILSSPLLPVCAVFRKDKGVTFELSQLSLGFVQSHELVHISCGKCTAIWPFRFPKTQQNLTVFHDILLLGFASYGS